MLRARSSLVSVVGFAAVPWRIAQSRPRSSYKINQPRRPEDLSKFAEAQVLSTKDLEQLTKFRAYKTEPLPAFDRMSDGDPEPVDIEELHKTRKLRRFDRVELTITELSANGEGVSRHVDGLVIFVEYAHPGSRVLAEVFHRRKNQAYAKIIRILEPSEDTVPKVCQHYPVCKGCRTQDLAYQAQLKGKQALVEKIFRKFTNVEVQQIIGSDRVFNYRNKMEFTYGTKEFLPSGPTKVAPKKDEFVLGMNAPRVWDKIIELKECHLMPQVGTDILNFVRRRTFESKFPAYDNYAHEGFYRNLILRFATNGSGHEEIMVNIVTSPTEAKGMLVPLAKDIAKLFPSVVSVLHSMTSSKGGSAVGESEVLLYGKPYLEQCLRGLVFKISANSFFQPNPGTAEMLYEVIEKFAELDSQTTVLDLFCGTGTIGLSLAKKCKAVHGVELVRAAVCDAEDNAKRNGINNATFYEMNLELTKIAPNELDLPKADVLIVDPPRAGLHPRLIKWIRLTRPQRIVYASCNPSTQFRDVDILCSEESPYVLKKVQPVDQFPHTPHCECVVSLELRKDYSPPSEHYV
eukprot:Plantae.Rhodophyta-Purpureofilum_apyrenoidigerum.ctg11016.p1 GENE.Plantae.Rhodophyta-Purpureofilum_apyrenoidigerum.ctg11016~~Plantae.Rhodophyta-Purpureofilum_apyrenoidigerum.ctg11016.p1  ORF type:complete len:574 (-),score=106.91 Plantae.Rhodophyta-Purpureofilum_apyrenoidigerum.ctg11016:117-1838(-)